MPVNNIEFLLPRILEIARLAPSVHNSQPWKVSVTRDSLKVQIDNRFALEGGDQTGRQAVISLGIFVESICLVAQDNGLVAQRIQFKNKEAVIRFSVKHNEPREQFSPLLRHRCSDRSIYRHVSINKETMQEIMDVSVAPDTSIKVSSDRTIIEQVAELTRKAMNTALSSPDFRQELSSYLVLPWSSKNRGIAVRSLCIPFIYAIFQPLMLKLGLGIQKEGNHEAERWLSASGLIFITAKGDMPHFWFNAGRTYLQCCLAIERLGLSQATSAAIVEASNYHEDIEALLHTHERILAVIRIGQGSSNKHYSPRVSVEELITSN